MVPVEQPGSSHDTTNGNDFRTSHPKHLFEEVKLRGQAAVRYFGSKLPDLARMPKILGPSDLSKRNFAIIRSAVAAESPSEELTGLMCSLAGTGSFGLDWLYHTLSLVCYRIARGNLMGLPIIAGYAHTFWKNFFFTQSCLDYEGMDINSELEDLIFSAGAKEVSWHLSSYWNPSIHVGGVQNVADFTRKLGEYYDRMRPYLVLVLSPL
jgi:hypothetical protein